MMMMPAKGSLVFYCDGETQWPMVVCELHLDEPGMVISGWAFESGKTSYYRKVPFSTFAAEKHWQKSLDQDERFGSKPPPIDNEP